MNSAHCHPDSQRNPGPDSMPRSPRLRVGLIGAGVMGRQHVGTMKQVPEVELVAVVDPFTSALADAERVPAFTDTGAMLEAVRPDAVLIVNPNELHVPTALECIAAGVPALLEKPVATSLEDARVLLEALRAKPVPILVGHHRRHNPVIARAKEIVAAGLLGRPSLATALWQTKKPDAYYDIAWRREPGAGVMLINLVHETDLLRHLYGEVVEVQAFSANALRGFAVEDTATISLRFESGALGSIVGSDAVASPWGWEKNLNEVPKFAKEYDQPCLLLAGTEGALSLPQLKLWRYGERADWEAPLFQQQLGYQADDPQVLQLRHFVRVARGEVAPLIGVEDAARTIAVIDAARRAARERRSVAPVHA